MQCPSRVAVLPAVLLLSGLAGCVVEGPPPPRQVVVEHPAPPRVYEAPPPGYGQPPPAVIVRP